MRFVFEVAAEVERQEGKFAGRDELADAIRDALESANPSDLEGEAEGKYEVVAWDVSDVDEAEQAKVAKRARRVVAAAEAALAAWDASGIGDTARARGVAALARAFRELRRALPKREPDRSAIAPGAVEQEESR